MDEPGDTAPPIFSPLLIFCPVVTPPTAEPSLKGVEELDDVVPKFNCIEAAVVAVKVAPLVVDGVPNFNPDRGF